MVQLSLGALFMFYVLDIILCFQNITNFVDFNFKVQHTTPLVINIEKIFKDSEVKSDCTVVILHKGENFFLPEQKKAFIIYDLRVKNFVIRLSSSCAFMVLLNLYEFKPDEKENIMLNYPLLNAVAIYSHIQPKNWKELYQFRNQLALFKIFDYKVLNRKTNKIILRSPKRFQRCEKNNPKCILWNTKFVVGFSHTSPYVSYRHWKDEEHLAETALMTWRIRKTFDDFVGTEANILKWLSNGFHIDFELMLPPDRTYGTNKNDTWTGKFGLIKSGAVDFILGPTAANMPHADLGEFSSFTYTIEYGFVTLAPKKLHNWQALLRPFSKNTWAVLVLSASIVGPIIWALAVLHYKLVKIKLPISLRKCSEVSRHVATNLLAEPWHSHLPQGPSSILLMFWLLACILIQSLYASNLTAFLSVPEMEAPIENFKDIWDRGKNLLTYSNGSIANMLRSSSTYYLKKLYQERLVSSTHLDRTSSETFLETCCHPHVSAISNLVIKYEIYLSKKRTLEEFHFSKQPAANLKSVWIFRKPHWAVSAFNVALLRLSDNGLNLKWMKEMKSFEEPPHQKKQKPLERNKQEKLGFEHLQGLVYFYIMGSALSIFALMVEVFIKSAETCIKQNYNLKIVK